MELEGNQTTKKTSIDPDCFEEKCHFLGGGGGGRGMGGPKLKSDEKRPWGIV